MATVVQIQKQNVALATLTMSDGKQIPIYITKEWRDPLALLAQAVAALQARLDAAGL